MIEQKKETQVTLQKLKRNELICGFLGLTISIFALIFLFVNAISFTAEIAENNTITFSTSIHRFLISDFTLHNNEWGSISLDSLINIESDVLQKIFELFLLIFSWLMFTGIVLSAIFYILFLCKKRLYWCCKSFTNMAAESGIAIFTVFFAIPLTSDFLPDGIKYNVFISILYCVIIIVLLVAVNALLDESKYRRDLLKEVQTQQMETVGTETPIESLPSDSPSKVIREEETVCEKQQMNPPSSLAISQGHSSPERLVSDEEKQFLLTRYRGKLSRSGIIEMEQQFGVLTAKKYQRLIEAPLKSKVATILFAIFLGGIGVDRFYVGDTKLGILKLVGSIISVVISFIPVLGFIVNIANWIWKFVDIFFSYKKIYDVNYKNAMKILAEEI